ncbi:MAG: hypothetical protein LC126_02780 [Bryobacterales bacterium]|nr:hypothetical protein [Bryobacterales bacterium]
MCVENLAHLLKRIGRFPRDKGIEIARKLCEAFSAAHIRGILHRDRKPADIMLNAAGQVLITDFGFALAIGRLRAREAVCGGTQGGRAQRHLRTRARAVRAFRRQVCV